MLNQHPNKTYRGTWDQLASHKDEIPPGAILELKIVESNVDLTNETDDFDGKSAADIILEIGTVSGLPYDLSTNPKHMEGFGEIGNRNKREP